MKTLTINLSDELAGKLNNLSQAYKIPESTLLNKALEIAIEDLEDIYLSEIAYDEFKKSNEQAISLEEMEKRLGLED